MFGKNGIDSVADAGRWFDEVMQKHLMLQVVTMA